MWPFICLVSFLAISNLSIVHLSSVPNIIKVIYDIEKAEEYFEEFVNVHNKIYETKEEKNIRFEIFKDNLMRIIKKNEESEHTVFGIDYFADITVQEWKERYTGFNFNENIKCEDMQSSARRSEPPKSLDWRKEGKVTDIKNQGNCGSCWAFSVVGNIEGQYAMKYNELKGFSEQQLVNCDVNEDSCLGGMMAAAILWLKENGGIMSEEDYPYTATKTSCKFDAGKAVAKVQGCYNYQPKDEDGLKAILAEVGPLSIGLDGEPLLGYTGGILHCGDFNQLNHGVVLVGYGTEVPYARGEEDSGLATITVNNEPSMGSWMATQTKISEIYPEHLRRCPGHGPRTEGIFRKGGIPYWLVKNSWGRSWGEDGYVRLAMYENPCNMTAYVNSAVLE